MTPFEQPLLTGCHLEVHVTDLHAARKFYVECLGLPVLQETPEIGLLAVRAGTIRLSIFGDAWQRVNERSHAHLVLSTRNLEQTLADLSARGLDTGMPILEAPGFCRYVQTADPDGNLVEIAQYLRDPLMPV